MNAQEILLSVVIPVYNGERYICSCIEQIQNQTLKTRYEIIIVNDGSTDNTLEFIQTYAEEDKRICVVSQNNKGVSAARNYGMKLAKGEWIVFVDVDDDIAPGYLADICQEIEKKPKADILIYARHYVGKDSKEIDAEKFTRNELICSLLTEEPLEELGKDFLLRSVCSKAYRKEMIKNNNISFLQGLRLGEDMLFQLWTILLSREIRFIYRGYYRYVQNSDSVMHRLRKDDTKTVRCLQKEIHEVLLPVWESEEVRAAFYKSILNAWFVGISSELRAWKQEESFFSLYIRLQEIRKEESFEEAITKVDRKQLGMKNRVKLFLMRRLPVVYLLLIRK